MKTRIAFILALCLSVSCSLNAQELFIGTGDFTAGTPLNDTFTTDVNTGVSTMVGSIDIWGATYDGAGTVYFSSVDGSSGSGLGDNLWTFDPATGTLTDIGEVTGVLADDIRLDGLAWSGGSLFAWNQFLTAGNDIGLYEIDLNTMIAVPVVIAVSTNISGIDADPATGIIYGVDDTLGQIVEIDPSGGTVTPIAAYSGLSADIDGLAASDGTLYLVADENSPIEVFDIATLTYTATLPSPFTGADVFSGAAYFEPVTGTIDVTPTDFNLTNGVLQSGGVNELSTSDNDDARCSRNPNGLQPVIRYEVKSTSAIASPSTMTFTIEESVFARGNITRTIELFDYVAGDWVEVDSRIASRNVDRVDEIVLAGSVSQYVEAGTGCVEARVTYTGPVARAVFNANVDHIFWTLGN